VRSNEDQDRVLATSTAHKSVYLPNKIELTESEVLNGSNTASIKDFSEPKNDDDLIPMSAERTSQGFELLKSKPNMVEGYGYLGEISEEDFVQLRKGNHRYEDHGKVFHMAIIDYLQKYNCLKQCERCCLPLWTKATQETVSVAKPLFYGERFYHFLERNLFSTD